MSDKKMRLIFALTSMLAMVIAPTLVCSQTTLKKVVIDAGHGGKDPGALGKKTQEKDIVLDVALRLGKMINDSLPEVETTYTRKTDVFIPLNERAEIANKNGADLFISIHANWVKNNEIRGAETFVLGLHRSKENLEVAQKENSVIVLEDDYTNTYEGFDPNEPESYIIFELMQNLYLEQSILMASMVQDSFGKIERNNRGVKQAGFLVLRQTSMPSILVELGFLSNAEEEAYMASEKGKKELVNSLFAAFKHYKMQYDSTNKVSMATGRNREKIDDDKGIIFRVQIANMSKPDQIKTTAYGDVRVTEENGSYKYTIGNMRSYDEAYELMNRVKADYPDSFIVATENGKKVTVKYARKKTGNK